jgi:hypothetical protein
LDNAAKVPGNKGEQGVLKGLWVGFDQGLTKVDQKESLGVVGEVFEVMA